MAVGSLLTTIGTAIVLGYVTKKQIAANSPDLSAQQIDSFLIGYRIVGLILLAANTVGILTLRGKGMDLLPRPRRRPHPGHRVPDVRPRRGGPARPRQRRINHN